MFRGQMPRAPSDYPLDGSVVLAPACVSNSSFVWPIFYISNAFNACSLYDRFLGTVPGIAGLNSLLIS